MGTSSEAREKDGCHDKMGTDNQIREPLRVVDGRPERSLLLWSPPQKGIDLENHHA